jgi:hypothetical protein
MAACPNTKRTYIQLRRGDTAYWAANGGTVLREGEPAYNTTLNRLKIGFKNASGQDQTWDQLPYTSGSGAGAGELAPGETILTASLPAGTVLNGTTVTISPLPSGVTVGLGQRISFTNITNGFTTSSIPIANNVLYYVKTIINATQFTISEEFLGGVQIVFNRTFSVASVATGGSEVIINSVSGITPAEDDPITFTNIASLTSSAVNGTTYYIHTVSSPTRIEIRTTLAGTVPLIFAAP